MSIISRTLDWYKSVLENFRDEIRTFGNFPSMFMALTTPHKDGDHNALLDHYDGVFRFVDESGNLVADNLDPRKYYDHIGEATESYSYLKSPYYLPAATPKGCIASVPWPG